MECCNNKQSLIKRLKAFLLSNDKNHTNPEGVAKKIALIGNPNVGKSVIFNGLTGAYVTVSNYPGTTVEVSRGWYNMEDMKIEIIDTPGMYSMLPITEEERVTRTLLMTERPDLILHVVDAKNLGRMLPLTIQLIESGMPVVLVLNIMDEAEALGIKINIKELQNLIGIPVVEASAAMNIGISELKGTIMKQIKKAA
ncbi:MAG: 50S ribosome-binding GTPase [Clostridia bacterium]|nr:50S ribosome-binding GTPase [Clostridia bacterium]